MRDSRSPSVSRITAAELRTTGIVYYYCNCGTGADSTCVAGSDSNAGTSMSAPRRTLDSARTTFRSMSAGDTIALCRGGVWADTDGGYLNNANCTAASPCDFRDYVPSWGSSSAARPLINVADGMNTFHVTSGSGYRIWNIRLAGDSYTADTEGPIRIYGTATDIDLCDLSLDTFALGIQIRNDGGAASGMVIRDSQFTNHGFAAIFGGGAGTIIDSNTFVNNGLIADPQEHTVYIFSDPGTADGMQFVNNDVSNDTRCNGVQIVVHGLLDNLVIANNRIVTTSTSGNCYGIQLASGISFDEFNNALIDRNRVTTAGAVPIEVSGCIDCAVSNNVATGGTLYLALNGCDSSSTGMACSQNMKVVNNTLYNADMLFGTKTSGTGFTIANNAIWNSSGGGLTTSGATIAVNTSNYVRAGSGAALSAVFTDAANGDFRPVAGGVLDGTGNSSYGSSTAIGTVTWSATDTGVTRASPVDIGAFQK